MLRRLIRDCRDCPATMALCSLWVLVYVLMVLTDLWQGQVPSAFSLLLGSINGHRFGDLTVNDLYHGEIWRTLTATFVHYGIIHLGMNLFGMYQLGPLVEEWYGAGQFLLLYVVIGAGGNALAGVIRHGLGLNPYIHSGGGSTVLLGLVALCAIVGWRLKTRKGDYLKAQMVMVLVITALLGLLPIIDNWVHVGGALCGAALGFADPVLLRNAGRRRALWAGVVGVLVMVASAAAQFRDDRAEAPERARQRWVLGEQSVAALARVDQSYALATRSRASAFGRFLPKEARGASVIALKNLEALRGELDRRPTSGDYRRVKALLERARTEPPTLREALEFRRHFRRLAEQAVTRRNTAARDYQALARRGRAR